MKSYGCQGCGKKYKVDIMVPNKIWKLISPKKDIEGAGLLCGSCICQRIENIFGYDAWYLRHIK